MCVSLSVFTGSYGVPRLKSYSKCNNDLIADGSSRWIEGNSICYCAYLQRPLVRPSVNNKEFTSRASKPPKNLARSAEIKFQKQKSARRAELIFTSQIKSTV